MTRHIKTWQDRLGNSAHIKSGGAVGEAMQAEIDELRAALAQQASAPAAVSGWKLVPVEPDEAQWGGLARDIVFWLYMNSGPHYGSKLHEHLRNLGALVPAWLSQEIPDADRTPPKGTVAACIYKAMLAAAPTGEPG